MMAGVIEIFDVPDERRFVLTVDDQRAGVLEYKISGDVFIAIHTEIDPAYAGQGLGSKLVQRVLDDVRQSGRSLRPLCPFVQRFLKQNPSYQDLVVTSRESGH